MLIRDGIPTKEDIAGVMPDKERMEKGPVAIAECFQNIACNPCTKACPKKAIQMEPDINARPVINPELCIGCGLCVAKCPGLAIFVVDMTYSEEMALVQLPFEFLPVPRAGQYVCGLNRAGEEQGWFEVIKARNGGKENLTWVLSLAVPKALAMEVRNIRIGGYRDGKQ